MQLFIKTPKGRTITIEVASCSTILCVKEKVREKEGIPLQLQRVVVNGKQHHDGRLLSDCAIAAEATVHITLRLFPTLHPLHGSCAECATTGGFKCQNAAATGHTSCIRGLVAKEGVGVLFTKATGGVLPIHRAASNGQLESLYLFSKIASAVQNRSTGGATTTDDPASQWLSVGIDMAIPGPAEKGKEGKGGPAEKGKEGKGGPAEKGKEGNKGGDSDTAATLLTSSRRLLLETDDKGATPAHYAAEHGHANFLRALHQLGGGASLVARDAAGCSPAHKAAAAGATQCISVLKELAAGTALETFNAADGGGLFPVHHAARNGHVECILMLHEHGARVDARSQSGQTAAHFAAASGHAPVLLTLRTLGCHIGRCDSDGIYPAHLAARNGHVSILRICGAEAVAEGKLGQIAEGDTKLGNTPAHEAAAHGHWRCLEQLHEVCAPSVSRSFAGANRAGDTPAHLAAKAGHADCLCILVQLLTATAAAGKEDGAGGDGVTKRGTALLVAQNEATGRTPATYAAAHGHKQCLETLAELGGGATFTWPAHASNGRTPAQEAAAGGHLDCLHVLHEVISQALLPQIAALSSHPVLGTTTSTSFAPGATTRYLSELREQCSLTWTLAALDPTAAQLAARGGHVQCVRYLLEIGGGTRLMRDVCATPSKLADCYSCLLTAPGLLPPDALQAALGWELGKRVAGGAPLALVSFRRNILEGLMPQLGVDEATGAIADAVVATPGVTVEFQGEDAVGDGLRREFFSEMTKAIVDPARGLFTSKDGGATLQPSPHSATTAGPEHLSYFAVLGRVAGLCLYHREPLPVALTTSFLKSVLGFSIGPDDLEAVDPHGAAARIACVRRATAAQLKALELTFVDDSNDEAIVYESKEQQRAAVALKPYGEATAVTVDNREEYLQLLAEHRLVGIIQPQIEAFRRGLGVYVDDALRATLRRCCTVVDVQRLLCGVREIDVDDWEATAEYAGSLVRGAPLVRWFWQAVRAMTREERSALLQFCTGSAHAPALGFAALTGFGGQARRFCLEVRTAWSKDRLPVASTCFNTLRLPPYTDAAVLQAKLRVAVAASGGGFDEDAVA